MDTRYHFQSRYGEEVFNGKTEFTYNIEAGSILFTNTPTKEHISSSFWNQNSIFALKELLPQMLDDPSIIITRQKNYNINNRSFYKFLISFNDKSIEAGFKIIKKQGTSFSQELIIDQETFLPYSYRTYYPNNRRYRQVTFQNINIDASRNESVWSYERFPESLSRQTYDEFFASQATTLESKIGSKAPEWKLPMVEGDSVSLSQQKGNLVLLEFWFPYCKGCIEAVPDILRISEKYKSKGLKVYGIEMLNSSYENLYQYLKEYNVKYPNLYQGKSVAKQYGVQGAPTFVLLDAQERFLYMKEGFDKQELIKIIEDNLLCK